MALMYEREFGYLRALEQRKQTQPKDIWVVPHEVWQLFDKLFIRRVAETNKIFTDNNYGLSQENGAIIIGLFQSAAAFLSTIKISERNELTAAGGINLSEEICHLIHHCLRNDLNKLSWVADDLMSNSPNGNNKELIDGIYKEIYDLVTKLKSLTED